MRFDLAANAIIGAREEQQDAFAGGTARLDDGRSAKLVVVADGMGGHVGGAIASAVAVDRFVHVAASGQWASHAETLRQALLAANVAIAERVEADPVYEGMGCTLVAVVLDGARLWFVSVGDSLLLRLAGARLERLNADHSMAPLIDRAAARAEPADPAFDKMQRNMLRSALTGRPIPMVDEGSVALAAGDWLLVATDGLLTLPPERIVETLVRNREADPARGVGDLLEAVSACAVPYQDNCTIAAIRVAREATGPRRPFRYLAGALMLAAGIAAIAYAWRALPLDELLPPAAAPAPEGRENPGPAADGAGSGRRPGTPRPPPPPPARPARGAFQSSPPSSPARAPADAGPARAPAAEAPSTPAAPVPTPALNRAAEDKPQPPPAKPPRAPVGPPG